MEVGNGVGGGYRKRKRLVLPDVVGGQRRESGEDLEVEGLDVLLGHGGGDGGERKVRVDGVENGVVGESGVLAGEWIVGVLVFFRHFQGSS